MATVDERVVSMKFDNKQFENGVSTSINTIDKLKRALNFKDQEKSFESLEASAKSVNNIDFSGLQKSLEKITFWVSPVGETIKKEIGEAFDWVENKVKGVWDSVFGQIVTGGKSRAMNIANAKFQLEGLGVVWDDIEKDISYGVQDTAYGLDAAAVAASQLVASGIEFGAVYGETGNSPMAKALRGISGVAAMTNSSYEDISRIFTTVAGQGRIMGDQLNQLAARGLNVAADLAKAYGVTESELRDMVSKGQVSFQMFSEAMDDAYGAHAKEANKTFNGALSNMKASMSRIGELFATPAYDALITPLNTLTKLFNKIKETIEPVSKNIKDLMYKVSDLGTAIIEKLIDGVSDFLDPFLEKIDKVTTALSTLVDRWTESVKKIGFKKEDKDAITNLTEAEKQAAKDIFETGKYGTGATRKKNLEELFGEGSYERIQKYIDDYINNGYKWEDEQDSITDSIEETNQQLDRLETILDNVRTLFTNVGIVMVNFGKIVKNIITTGADVLFNLFGIRLTSSIGSVSNGIVDFSSSLVDLTDNNPKIRKLFTIVFTMVSHVLSPLKKVSEFIGGLFSDNRSAEQEKFANSLKNVFDTVLNVIGVLSNVYDIFQTIIGSAVRSFIKVFNLEGITGDISSLSTSLLDITDWISEVLKNDPKIDAFFERLFDIANRLWRVINFVASIVTGLIGNILKSDATRIILEDLYQIFSNVRDVVSVLFDKLASGENSPLQQLLLNLGGVAWGTISLALESFIQLLNGLASLGIEELLELINKLPSLPDLLNTVSTTLNKAFSDNGVIKTAFKYGSDLINAFIKGIFSLDWNTILKIAVVSGLVYALFEIATLLKDLSAFAGLRGSGATRLKAMAILIASIAASLFVLSFVDTDKLLDVAGVLVVTYFAIALITKIILKNSTVIFSSPKTFIQAALGAILISAAVDLLSAAFLIFTASLVVLSLIPTKKIISGLLAAIVFVGAMVAILVIAVRYMSKVTTLSWRTSTAMATLGRAIETFAMAVLIVSASILILSLIEPDRLISSLFIVITIMGSMLLLVEASNRLSGAAKILGLAVSLLLLSVAINLLILPITILSRINSTDAFLAIAILGSMIGMMLALFKAASQITNALKGVGVVWSIVAAVVVLSNVLLVLVSLKIISGLADQLSYFASVMTAEVWADVIGSFLLFVGAIYAFGVMTKTFKTSSLIAIGVALIAISVALMIFTNALMKIGGVDITAITLALLSFVLTFAAIGALSKIFKASDMLIMSASLILIGIGLSVFASALQKMSSVDSKQIGGLIAAVVLLAVLSAIGKMLGTGLIAIGVGVILLAASCFILSAAFAVAIKTFMMLPMLVDAVIALADKIKRTRVILKEAILTIAEFIIEVVAEIIPKMAVRLATSIIQFLINLCYETGKALVTYAAKLGKAITFLIKSIGMFILKALAGVIEEWFGSNKFTEFIYGWADDMLEEVDDASDEVSDGVDVSLDGMKDSITDKAGSLFSDAKDKAGGGIADFTSQLTGGMGVSAMEFGKATKQWGDDAATNLDILSDALGKKLTVMGGRLIASWDALAAIDDESLVGTKYEGQARHAAMEDLTDIWSDEGYESAEAWMDATVEAYDDSQRKVHEKAVGAFGKIAGEYKSLMKDEGSEVAEAYVTDYSEFMDEEGNIDFSNLGIENADALAEGFDPNSLGLDMGEDTVDSTADALEQDKQVVSDAAEDLANAIMTTFSGIVQPRSYNVGEQLVNGLIQGMGENSYKLPAAVEKIASHLPVAFQKVLGIHSPSRVFAELGSYVIEGLANGIDGSSSQATDAMENAGDSMIVSILPLLDHIRAILNGEEEYDMSIRPTLDLTDVRNGAGEISSLFGNRSMTLSAANARLNNQTLAAQRDINLSNQNGSRDVVNAINVMRGDINSLADAMSEMQLVMDSGALVGSISRPMDAALGRRSMLKGRRN